MEAIKILHLPLKAKWYEMQESGEKTEEYRELTEYWRKRLIDHETLRAKPYTHACFRYGYTRRCFINRIDSITIGMGLPEWGAPTDREVFIIKHHKEDSPILCHHCHECKFFSYNAMGAGFCGLPLINGEGQRVPQQQYNKACDNFELRKYERN